MNSSRLPHPALCHTKLRCFAFSLACVSLLIELGAWLAAPAAATAQTVLSAGATGTVGATGNAGYTGATGQAGFSGSPNGASGGAGGVGGNGDMGGSGTPAIYIPGDYLIVSGAYAGGQGGTGGQGGPGGPGGPGGYGSGYYSGLIYHSGHGGNGGTGGQGGVGGKGGDGAPTVFASGSTAIAITGGTFSVGAGGAGGAGGQGGAGGAAGGSNNAPGTAGAQGPSNGSLGGGSPSASQLVVVSGIITLFGTFDNGFAVLNGLNGLSTYNTGTIRGKLMNETADQSISYVVFAGGKIVLSSAALGRWRNANFGRPDSAGKGADDAAPFGDNVPNLLKFALNLNAKAPDATPMTAAGAKGLPLVALTPDNRLSLTFVRRRAATLPGITYVVEFANGLNGQAGFAPNASATISQPTPIDDTWERVTVTDSVVLSKQPTRLVHLRVSSP